MSDIPSLAEIATSAGVALPPVFTNGLPGVQLPPPPPRPVVPFGYEKALSMLGLGHPLTRAVAGFAIAGALMFTMRPDWAFDFKGRPRPWSMFLIGHAAKDATKVPWWMVCSGTALSVALFL